MRKEFLPGGSGGVWRVQGADGETRVHRPTGPWTPAVHALLEHLAAKGLDRVPRVLGFDEEGREILTYLPGDTLDAETALVRVETLIEAARWLRRFHDAVADFRPEQTEWRQGVQALGAGEVICHNDTGLYNWVVLNDGFAGMIDWDRAGPGRPIDDLAFMCWSGVPLLREIPAADAVARLRAVAEAYGGVTAAELLVAVEQRMHLIAERWRVGLEREDPGTVALRDTGVMERHFARVNDFGRRLPSLRAELLGEHPRELGRLTT